jgi:hypothetical protein
MGGSEQQYVQDAFGDTNWVAPFINVNGLEQSLEYYLGNDSCCSLKFRYYHYPFGVVPVRSSSQ